jgi:hypothetical protein
MVLRRAPLVLPLLLLAACGQGGGDPRPRDARLAELRPVVAGWADAVARGDADRATGYFALPAVIEQGSAFRLTTRAQIRLFNAGLPCSAKLLSLRREGRYVVAGFRLGPRKGFECAAAGEVAEVALVFKGRRFAEWRQIPESRAPDAAPREAV